MANLQKYDVGDYTVQAAEAEAEELKKKGGSKEYDKLIVGDNVRRILPGTREFPQPWVEVSKHYFTPQGKQFPVSWPCPRIHLKEACPDCAEGFELYNAGNKADKDAGFELLPKSRYYYNVINKAEPERGVLIAEYGKTVHNPLVELRRNPVAGGDFTHPEKGFDIVINRVGTTKNDTKYSVFPSRQSTPLENMEWLNQRHDLQRFLIVPTPEEVAALKRGDEKGVAVAHARDVTPQATRQLAGRSQPTGRASPTQRAANPRQAVPKGRTAQDDADQQQDDDVPI